MRTLKTLLILTLPWLFAVNAYGQEATISTVTPSDGRDYKFAMGLRYSVGKESEISVSGKYFFTPKSALHLTAGRLVSDRRNTISLSYERYHSLLHSANFQFFYGAGLSSLIGKDVNELITHSSWRIYGNATAGIRYQCKSLPLAFSVDGKKVFPLSGGFRPFDNNSMSNFALSAHYLIK